VWVVSDLVCSRMMYVTASCKRLCAACPYFVIIKFELSCLFVWNGRCSILIILQISLYGNLKASYMELVAVCTDAQFLERVVSGQQRCSLWRVVALLIYEPWSTRNNEWQVGSIHGITSNIYGTVHIAAGILQCFDIKPSICPYECVEFLPPQILIQTLRKGWLSEEVNADCLAR
jgi:hypothetical protein